MNKPTLLRMMRLLSGLESAMLCKAPYSAYLLDEIGEVVTMLEKEILEAPTLSCTDWKAIARVQSAKLHAALDEPGARERLDEIMASHDWQPVTSVTAQDFKLQPLTDEQIDTVFRKTTNWIGGPPKDGLMIKFARAIEQAHGIKLEDNQ